jgi:hypothetical protein
VIRLFFDAGKLSRDMIISITRGSSSWRDPVTFDIPLVADSFMPFIPSHHHIRTPFRETTPGELDVINTFCPYGGEGYPVSAGPLSTGESLEVRPEVLGLTCAPAPFSRDSSNT